MSYKTLSSIVTLVLFFINFTHTNNDGNFSLHNDIDSPATRLWSGEVLSFFTSTRDYESWTFIVKIFKSCLKTRCTLLRYRKNWTFPNWSSHAACQLFNSNISLLNLIFSGQLDRQVVLILSKCMGTLLMHENRKSLA